jgi:predicted hydrocarbon binding protein
LNHKTNIFHDKNSRRLCIDEWWILSLKNILSSLYGNETSEALFFEHGRNLGRIFFQKIRKNEQNLSNSSQEYLDKFCEGFTRSGFATVEIRSYEFCKKCECRIDNHLKETIKSFFCGLLTGLLESLWDKKIEVELTQDPLSGSYEVVLQRAL